MNTKVNSEGKLRNYAHCAYRIFEFVGPFANHSTSTNFHVRQRTDIPLDNALTDSESPSYLSKSRPVRASRILSRPPNSIDATCRPSGLMQSSDFSIVQVFEEPDQMRTRNRSLGEKQRDLGGDLEQSYERSFSCNI